VEAHFSKFGDSANLDAIYVHGLNRLYHWLRNYFGRTGWNFLVTWVMWNVVLVRLETGLASVQERCMVYVECSKAQKSFWTHPMVHLVEACFGPFGDSANLDAR
jgi:hypothetical protein